MSGRARKVPAILLGASALSLGLLALRMLVRGDATYGFLAWNLFLAWVPLVLAVIVVAVWRSRWRILVALPFALWLLFFPNAPYVVTDFVHLDDIGGMPGWFDVLLLGSFAVTSLALAFVSLYLIQDLIRRAAGVASSWVCALAVIGLSGVGIYLGRVYQLNSWDVLQPARLLGALSGGGGPAARESGALLTLLLTCMLGAAYALGQRLAARRLDTPR